LRQLGKRERNAEGELRESDSPSAVYGRNNKQDETASRPSKVKP